MSALQPAHSSWIAFHGYSNGTMTLITKSGESYAATIPESRYTDFVKSPSPGSFFNLYIKPFATVTKVDVTEDVALVEKAKAKLTLDGKIDEIKAKMEAAATPNSRTYRVPRKAPAKSKLPKEPWDGKGGSIAWIDFRCLADPTTGPGLVAALKAFIAGKSSISTHFVPIAQPAKDELTNIVALGHLGSGYVDPKYLKAFTSKYTTAELRALANAYRSAYRSWVRRQEAKQAKAASEPVAASIYGFSGGMAVASKAIETAAKEVFAGGWSGKTEEQIRAEKAEAVLKALEGGMYSVTVGIVGTNLGVAGYSFTQKRN